MSATITTAEWSEIWHAAGNGVSRLGAAEPVIERIITARLSAHEAQIRDLLEEREELLTEIRRLRMGNHSAGRALAPVRVSPQPDHLSLAEALTERDAEHEGGGS